MTAKIYIASSNVTFGINTGKDHSYLFYDPDTDGDNDPTTGTGMQIIRGGRPANHNISGVPNNITIELYDDAETGTSVDWFTYNGQQDSPTTRNFFELSSGAAATTTWSLMRSFAQSLGTPDSPADSLYNTGIDYDALGPNSNSVINSVLNSQGIDFRDATPYADGSTTVKQTPDEYPGHMGLLDGDGDNVYTAYIYDGYTNITNFYKRGGTDTIILEWDNSTDEHARVHVKNERDSTDLTTIYFDGLNYEDVNFYHDATNGNQNIRETLYVKLDAFGISIAIIEGFFADRTSDASEGAQTTAFEFEDTIYRHGDSGDNTLNAGTPSKSGLLRGFEGDDILIGGEKRDTADYSTDSAKGGTGDITATMNANGTATVVDGWGDTDALTSIEIIKAGSGTNDAIDFSDRASYHVDATHNYYGTEQTNEVHFDAFDDVSTFDQESGAILNKAGSFQVTPENFEAISVSRVVLDPTQTYPDHVSADILDLSSYGNAITFDWSMVGFGLWSASSHMGAVAGTDYGDTFMNAGNWQSSFTSYHPTDGNVYGQSSYWGDIYTGAGNDTVRFVEYGGSGEPAPIYTPGYREFRMMDIHYRGGDDVYHVDETLGSIVFDPAIASGNVTFTKGSYADGFKATFSVDGPGDIHDGSVTVYFDTTTHNTTNSALSVNVGGTLYDFTASSANGVLGSGTSDLSDVQASWWRDVWEASDSIDDFFNGLGGADIITGGNGADTLMGGSGDDTIYYGLGGDTVTGGSGSDVFVLQAQNSATVITDFDATQDTLDTRIVTGASAISDLTLIEQGEDLLITLDGINPFITLLNTNAASISASNFAFYDDSPVIPPSSVDIPDLEYPSVTYTTVNGTSSGDFIYGDTYSTTNPLHILGYGGGDFLYGWDHEDILDGGLGSDDLFGYDGDDVLRGGGGYDYADGDYGNDIYELYLGSWSGTYADLTIDDADGVDFIVVPNVFFTDDIYLYESSGTWFLEASVEGYDDQTNANFGIGQYLGEGSGSAGVEFIVVQDVVYELDWVKDNGFTFRPPTPGFDPNKNPILKDDILQGFEDTVLSGNVFANNGNGVDYDPDGFTMSAVAQDTYISGLGQFKLYANGNFELTPEANTAVSNVAVEYDVEDADGYVSTATMYFTLDAVNETLVSTIASEYLDGGPGSDTVSYENATQAMSIDLYNGSAYGDGTDTLANIENAIGSDYDDYIALGAYNVQIDGGTGQDRVDYLNMASSVWVDLTTQSADRSRNGTTDDTFISIEGAHGSNYDDRLTGDASANIFYGRDGDDEILAGDGDDTINGDAGNDTIDGGAGTDTLFISGGSTGSILNLSSASWAYDGTNTVAALTLLDGFGDTDTLSSIENVFGGLYGDQVLGSSADNVINGFWGDDTLLGGGGNDTLVGGDGNDTLDGGSGIDTVDYSAATSGVTIELNNNRADEGRDGSWNDTFANIENIIATDYDDYLLGNNSANIITGGAGGDFLLGFGGDDTLLGGDGNDEIYKYTGNETFDGGSGIDTLAFTYLPSSINVNLANATYTTSYGSGSAINIENVYGTNANDSITGSAEDNVLVGQNGADTIYGGAGNDVLYGDNTSGTPDNAQDILYGEDGDDTLFGSYGDDFLYGGAGNDLFYAYAGDETFDGGAGTEDYLSFYYAVSSLTIDVISGTATNVGGEIDSFSNVEKIDGGSYADTMTGDSASNYLNGAGGNDTIYGGAGNDTLSGGSTGDDILYGQAGNDLLLGDTGNDVLDGGDDDDLIAGHGGQDTLTGGNGADTFSFGNSDVGTGVDTITDFNTSEGDVIDIAAVLSSGYDPLSDAIEDFLQITDNGTDSFAAVDVDGGADNFVQFLTIEGVTGLTDEAALVTSGALIAA